MGNRQSQTTADHLDRGLPQTESNVAGSTRLGIAEDADKKRSLADNLIDSTPRPYKRAIVDLKPTSRDGSPDIRLMHNTFASKGATTLELRASLSPTDAEWQILNTLGDDFRHLIRILGKCERQWRHQVKEMKSDLIDIRVCPSLAAESNATPQDSKGNQSPGSLRIAEQPKTITGATMRDYQLQGLTWLRSLYDHGTNGILADEMGIGKTIQIIALISSLRESGIDAPFIIIAPLSTIQNWVDEFRKFAPNIPVLGYKGDMDTRENMRQSLKGLTSSVFPVIITNFEACHRDGQWLNSYRWRLIVIDEAHRMKNSDATLSRVVKRFRTTNLFLVTGTPLQNNLQELWSLLNLLDPGTYHSLDRWNVWFSLLEHQTDDPPSPATTNTEMRLRKALTTLLKPILLRRQKGDVGISLPRKKLYTLYAPLSRQQHDLLRAVTEDRFRACLIEKMLETPPNERFPDAAAARARREAAAFEFLAQRSSSFQNRSMLSRQICNSPHLFYRGFLGDIGETLMTESGKMRLFDRLVPPLVARGHKILVFSQFTSQLDLLEEYCTAIQNWEVFRIDGNVDAEKRSRLVRDFADRASTCQLFLLTTRAGGVGINLTAADTVIIFDSDWNPQQDLQAQDRSHRIKQTRPVDVFRFVVQDSVESGLLQAAASKRKMEREILTPGRFAWKTELAAKSDENSVIEIEVHHGGEAHVLTDDQLHLILDRSA